MQAELDHVEGNWSSFFRALGGIAAMLEFSMIQFVTNQKWRGKNMIRHISQILLGAIVAIAVSIVGSFVWLTALSVAGLQLSSLPLWPRLVFISLLDVIYIAIATVLWGHRRKLVSVGISLAGLAQLLSVILTVIRFEL